MSGKAARAARGRDEGRRGPGRPPGSKNKRDDARAAPPAKKRVVANMLSKAFVCIENEDIMSLVAIKEEQLSAGNRAAAAAALVLLLWHLCAFYAFNLDDVNSPEEQQLEDELDEDSESVYDDDVEATLAPITNADKDHLWQLGHKLITIRDKVMQLDPEILDWQMLQGFGQLSACINNYARSKGHTLTATALHRRDAAEIICDSVSTLAQELYGLPLKFPDPFTLDVLQKQTEPDFVRQHMTKDFNIQYFAQAAVVLKSRRPMTSGVSRFSRTSRANTEFVASP